MSASKSKRYAMVAVAAAMAAGMLPTRQAGGQVSGTWLGGTGNWSDPARWTSNPSVPGDGGGAHFSDIGSSGTITLDLPVSLGTLSFNSPGRFRFAGGGITLVGPAVLHVEAGPTQILPPLAGTAGLTKTGPGGASLASSLTSMTGGTNILGGTLLAQTGALPAGSITLDGGRLAGVSGTFGTFTMSQTLHVGSSGTFSSSFRAELNGAITGSGTFTIHELGVGSGSTTRFTATSPFAGHFHLRDGVATFSGNGSMPNVAGLTIDRRLYIDNTLGGSSNRIHDTAPVMITGGGEFHVQGGAAETVGILTVARGSATASRLNVLGIERQERATLGATNLIITGSPPAMIGAGQPGTTMAPVIPFVVAQSGLSNLPATVDGGIVRALGLGEVTGLFGDPGQNVWIGGAHTLSAARTINSLTLDSATLSGSTLTVASGVVCLNGTTTLAVPLSFDNREGILYAGGSGEKIVSGPISGSAGLTIGRGTVVLAGANTYTGVTTVNDVLQVNADVMPGVPGPLGTSSSPVVLHTARLSFGGTSTVTFGRDVILRSDNNNPSSIGPFLSEMTPPIVITGNIDTRGPFGLSGGFGSDSVNRLVVSGNITGDGRLMFPSSLTLAGDNTFSGGIYLSGGPLGIGSDTALGTGMMRFVNAGTPTVQAVGAARTVNNPVEFSSQRLLVQGSLPLTFNGDVNISDGTHTLTTTNTAPTTFAGEVFGGALVKSGAGLLNVRRARLDHLTMNDGTLRLLPGGTADSTSVLGGLTFIPPTPTAMLDITNNALVVDYTGASSLATIAAHVAAGYADGAWSGNGIVSSLADASTHGVGFAEASALADIPAIFGNVDDSAILIRLTRYGDANLDGTVNLQDFNRLAANFGAGQTWAQGDFNYDGMVNLADFNRLAANFGLSASGPEATPSDWAALAAAVPEPGALGLAVTLSLSLAGTRRRGSGQRSERAERSASSRSS